MTSANRPRPTLGLAMIMKDEIAELERNIKEHGEYFDKIYITATRKDTYAKLKKKVVSKHPAYKKVELSYFEWIDHFGRARNYNISQVKTDYWMSIDPDDEILGAENLHKVIEYMIAKKLDATVFPYETPRRTNLSQPTSVGWRERIIRTGSGLKYADKAIHENIYIEGDTDMLVKDVYVRHRKTAEEKGNSSGKYKSILEKEWQREPSAETAKYLGATLIDIGDYEGAIEKILYSAEHYESRAERFRAWQRLAECYYYLGRNDATLAAANKCIEIDQDHPAPWYQKFKAYQAAGMHNAAMYCAETAMSKKVEGELAILLGSDPSQYEYRGPFDVAIAYLSLGKAERAYELYQQVKKTAPRYIEELSANTKVNWDQEFINAYKKQKSANSTDNTNRSLTLGLAMIMKDEIEDVERIMHDYGEYFDKIYITATRRDTHTKLLSKIAAKDPAYKKVELSYFKWIDHFGRARNYNLSQVKTDYWFCMDPDDEIEGAENLRGELDDIAGKNLDVVWFRFEAVRRTSLSEPASYSWRERIVRRAPNLVWKDVAVHETLDESIQGEIKEELHTGVIVKNRKTAKQMLQSRERNKLILERDWKREPTAVTGYYLGGTLMETGDYKDAIEKLTFAAENSDIIPIQFVAWQHLSECYMKTGQHDAALAAAERAAAIDPDHPAPWYKKFAVYRLMGENEKAMQSAETAMSKKMEGGRGLMLTQDPTWYQFRGPFEVAKAYLSIGDKKRARELYEQVKKTAPFYIEQQSAETGKSWDKLFKQGGKS